MLRVPESTETQIFQAGGKAKMKAPDIPDNTNTDKIWRQRVSRLAAAPLLYAGGCVVEGWRGSLI